MSRRAFLPSTVCTASSLARRASRRGITTGMSFELASTKTVDEFGRLREVTEEVHYTPWPRSLPCASKARSRVTSERKPDFKSVNRKPPRPFEQTHGSAQFIAAKTGDLWGTKDNNTHARQVERPCASGPSLDSVSHARCSQRNKEGRG
jgi:hypothetical protein